MKILVLGGNGFIGKHVMRELAGTGNEAISLSRQNGLDLLDYSSTAKKFDELKPDVIINCAAHVGSMHYVSEKAADVLHDNLNIVLNIYKAVKDASPKSKIVNPISNCSYPGESLIQREDEWWNGPVHPSVLAYGVPRRVIPVVSECYSKQYGIKSVNFIFPNSYGPGDYTDPNKTHALNGMILRMLDAKKKNASSFEIWGTGSPKREWGYAADLARMLKHGALNIANQINPLNFAQNKSYSIKETAEMIKAATGYGGELVYNTKYPDGAPIKQLDDEKFRKAYPDFKFTDIKVGVENTVEYYKSIGVG